MEDDKTCSAKWPQSAPSVNFLVKQSFKTAELEIIFLSVIVLKAVLALNFSGCPFLWLSNQP